IRITCQRIGRPPISTSGFGIVCVSSRSRVPRPPHRITTDSSTAGTLSGRARGATAVEQATAGRAELEQRVPRPQDHPKGAVHVVATPGQRRVAAVQAVAPASASAHDVLREPALWTMALEIVVVSADDDLCVAREPVPERVQIGRATVRARAVARAVPERDTAVARSLEGQLEPAHLGRLAPMRSLRVQAEDLPAGDARLEPGREPLALAAVPVAVVAAEAVVPLVV